MPRTDPVIVTVTADGVTYDDGTNLSKSGDGITLDSDTSVYTMLISNTSGAVLPSTGGSGTMVLYAVGAVMVALAGALLVRNRREA